MTFSRVLSSSSAVPLYRQLREFLRERIESGEWESGRRLPSELDLAKEFAVSRITVRQAMRLLENDGLVERVQGRGTFVGRPKIAQDLHAFVSLSASLRRSGAVGDVRLIHLRQIRPEPSIGLKLSIDQQDEVYELKRLFIADGEPLMLITSWLPVKLFPDLGQTVTPQSPSLAFALRNYYGVNRVHQHRELEVTVLDDGEAQLLGVQPVAPAILLTHLSFVRENQPFEYRKMVVRGDRCKYYIEIDVTDEGV